jgi:hypothetical protein
MVGNELSDERPAEYHGRSVPFVCGMVILLALGHAAGAGSLAAQQPLRDRSYGAAGAALGVQVGTVGASYEEFTGVFGVHKLAGFARWVAKGGFGVGASLERASVGGVQSPAGVPRTPSSTLLSATLQALYFLNTSNGAINPHVGLRLGRYRRSEDGEALDVSASGFGIGAVAGVQSILTPGIGVQGTVTFDFASLGDRTENGVRIDDSRDTFSVLSFAVGLSLHFGAH